MTTICHGIAASQKQALAPVAMLQNCIKQGVVGLQTGQLASWRMVAGAASCYTVI